MGQPPVLTPPNDFDASEAVCLRSPLSTFPAGIIVPTFLQRSPPSLLTTAACSGLGSATRSPNPKGLPSSLVQLRAAVWTGVTRDTRPIADFVVSERSGRRRIRQ